MPTKGTAFQEGKPGKRTIIRLKPVSYSISLVYLGADHVKREDTAGSYRCQFVLDDGVKTVAALAVIPNIAPTISDDKAATPFKDGGDNTQPADTTAYRLVVQDYHTPKSGPDYQETGKDAYYVARNWLGDIRPAAPFRLVIRRFAGDKQVPVRDTMKVRIELKDPPEEFNDPNLKPTKFLQEFFKKFNQKTAHETKGDDNHTDWGTGDDRREHPGQPGGKAKKSLRKIKTAKAGLLGKNVVEFADLLDPVEDGVAAAHDDPKKVQEQAADGSRIDIFVADFAFCPWPAWGDNYRCLITLLRGNQDIRDTEEHGSKVKVYDNEDREIGDKRGYLTGKITLWRKLPITLVVLVNEVTGDKIDWNIVRGKYRGIFTEIELPGDEGCYTVSKSEWAGVFKQTFPPSSLKKKWQWLTLTDAEYRKYFYPPFLYAQEDDVHTHPITRDLIRLACQKKGLTPPFAPTGGGTGDVDQDKPNGLFVVVMKRLKPDHGDLGEFVHDRHLNTMYHGDDPDMTSVKFCRTVAHEIGHALHLAHAWTKVGGECWYAAAEPDLADEAKRTTFFLVDPNSDQLWHHQLAYHDPNDAMECLMGYTGRDNAEFCGVCSLILRMYPIDKLKAPGNAGYQNEAVEFFKTGSILEVVGTLGPSGYGVVPLADPHPLAIGASVEVIALGPVQDYTRRWKNDAAKARVLLTKVAGAVWSQNPAGRVELTPGVACRIKGKAAGDVTVTLKVNTTELKCKFRVA